MEQRATQALIEEYERGLMRIWYSPQRGRYNRDSWKTRGEALCGEQVLLVRDEEGNLSLCPDGLTDEGEYVEAVYRINLFGKLRPQPYYSFPQHTHEVYNYCNK